MVLASKPSIDTVVSYLKSAIPHCSINQKEIEQFKPVYERADYKSSQKIFHKAIFMHAPQPISFMTRQLQLIAPPKVDSNGQMTHDWRGRTVESGTNWRKIYAAIEQKRQVTRQSYDAKHGQGSFDKAYRKWGKDWHKWADGLCNGKSYVELKPISAKETREEKELGIGA